jgi:Ca2+-binding RTX toxin-like protein
MTSSSVTRTLMRSTAEQATIAFMAAAPTTTFMVTAWRQPVWVEKTDFKQTNKPTLTHTGDAGDDSLFGDAGSDMIHGGAGDDNVRGGDGDDYIYGTRLALLSTGF